MTDEIPIVVLTPVKNEDWILERFLAAASVFADLIIVADQYSTDDSVKIAKKFEKVKLVHIPTEEYDEAFRQKLLISKAREWMPTKKLLVALDADEFIAGNSIKSSDWLYMKNAEPGTLFTANKVDLLYPLSQYINHPPDYLKFAFLDDGIASHAGALVHSHRLPQSPTGKIVHLEHFKIIHFARVRRQVYWDKKAYYSMLENISGSRTLLGRIGFNSKRLYQFLERKKAEETPHEWLVPWQEKHGISLTEFERDSNLQLPLQIVKLFQEYGEKRFFLDDIWDRDWNTIIRDLKEAALIEETFNLKGPSLFHKMTTSLIIFLWKIRRMSPIVDHLSLKLMRILRQLK